MLALSCLVTGPSFMSISLLVLELQQYSLIRNWPEIWKSKIPPSEFWPISEDWGDLGIQNSAGRSHMKCYWMLQKARITAFAVSQLLRKTQQEGGRGVGGELRTKSTTPSPYTQVRVTKRIKHWCFPLKFTKFLRTPISKNICKNNCSLIFFPWKLSLLKYLKRFAKFTGNTKQNL